MTGATMTSALGKSRGLGFEDAEDSAFSIKRTDALLKRAWMDSGPKTNALEMTIEVFHKATVYVDESIRTHRDTQQWLCCVTAYIASFDSWIEAEREWQGVLDSFGVSESHLTDFLARQKQFKNDWSDTKRNLFMERLCTVASQRPIMGVGAAISQTDWEAGLSETVRGEWTHPYYFCTYGMLSLIRSMVLRDPTSSLPLPLFFLFDNKPKFEGAALELYREYQTKYDPKGKSSGASTSVVEKNIRRCKSRTY
jgi:hypothetical protein